MSDVIDKIIKSSFELLLYTFFDFKILCLKKEIPCRLWIYRMLGIHFMPYAFFKEYLPV